MVSATFRLSSGSMRVVVPRDLYRGLLVPTLAPRDPRPRARRKLQPFLRTPRQYQAGDWPPLSR